MLLSVKARKARIKSYHPLTSSVYADALYELKMKFLSKGKRGMVYLIEDKGIKKVIKEKRKESTAINSIANEAKWLKVLNKYNIGPRFCSFKDGTLMMEYIEGRLFADWLKEQSDNSLLNNVIIDILKQCYTMDRLNIEKKEMHKPVKHIIIRNNKPVLIDFERCRKTLKPSNVTQFCQYLKKLGLIEFDESLLQAYRRSISLDSLHRILMRLKPKVF